MKKILYLCIAFFLALFMYIPVQADSTAWVTDNADILTDEEEQELTERIAAIVSDYGAGVYIYTSPDMGSYDSVEDYAEAVYNENSLGLGDDQDGILLVMEFSGRSYDICAHGNISNTAFTDYAKEKMGDALLEGFGDDSDWKYGFDLYLDEVENDLQASVVEGCPVDVRGCEDPEAEAARNQKILTYVPLIGGPLIALLACWIMASKNKTKGRAYKASGYQNGAIHLTRREDMFTHTTRTVTHVHHDNGGGGTSVNSGGFSHSSGHF